ncbi:unnamed protein product [Acanthoscelides obtectus]|uniref:Uncharacterized protein n=1 Tax=Acanthoscelides obtectus TaxID=200917 RepID=A0A9P0P2F2_ACAOB|nr:unnamed protein product [Acanthoscelides obtectus]CAK1648041.1 hypothetical protein AOBTE_LOCUS15517 [Acanthoscelides obtectus]
MKILLISFTFLASLVVLSSAEQQHAKPVIVPGPGSENNLMSCNHKECVFSCRDKAWITGFCLFGKCYCVKI